MGWTAPSATVTGQLITSAFWNAQVTNNMSLLKTSVMDDGTLKVCPYAPTVANVLNTTTQTTILSFSVPGNDIADGDGIEIFLTYIFSCNAPGSPHVKADAFWGATSVTLFDYNTNNTAVDRLWQQKLTMQRCTNDLYLGIGINFPSEMTFGAFNGGQAFDFGGAANAVKMTTPTFSSTQTFALKITLDQAFANYYLKPQGARVLRWKQ